MSLMTKIQTVAAQNSAGFSVESAPTNSVTPTA